MPWKWGVDVKIHALLAPDPGFFDGRPWASRCRYKVYTWIRELLGLNLEKSTAYTHTDNIQAFPQLPQSYDHAR
jgi:hypothetical protein